MSGALVLAAILKDKRF